MNFSVHFDEPTIDRLALAVQRTGLARNRIIARAVQEWLERNEEKDWPAGFKAHLSNPAPELAEEALDLQAWRAALPAQAETRW